MRKKHLTDITSTGTAYQALSDNLQTVSTVATATTGKVISMLAEEERSSVACG